MAQGQKGITASPFTINKNSDGVTYLTSDLATSSTWQDLLIYAVPLGVAFEITPANYIYGEYYNTGGVTSGNKITAGMSRILKSNANRSESREIWSGSNALFYNLGDIRQRPSLTVGVMVQSSQKLIVQVLNLGTTLDVSTSDFYLQGVSYYEEI